MTVEYILEEHHVVRYISPSLIRKDGSIDGRAFVLRKKDSGISVNWLEYFSDLNTSERIDRIRSLVRLDRSKNGRFAKLNVGETKSYVVKKALENGISVSLNFIKSPLPANEKDKPDLSHAEIVGVPNPSDEDRAMFIGQSIARCVKTQLYPAKITP